MNSSLDPQQSSFDEQQIKIIEACFEWIAPQGHAFASRFYDRLFEDHPEVIPLFENSDREEQQAKLLNALTVIVYRLRHPDHLRQFLTELGQRHVLYGVSLPHYDAVIDTLLIVLAEFAEDAWSPVMEESWTNALKQVKLTMLEGARTATDQIRR